MTFWIGIDPGLNGATAVIDDEFKIMLIGRTPTIQVGKRRQHNVAEMVHYFKQTVNPQKAFAVLETAHARPGQGVVSMFSFGRGFGIWEGILAALGIPYILVSPQAWKKVMLCDTDKSKGAAKIVASRLWPALGKLTDGEAESLLMAEYGRRHG